MICIAYVFLNHVKFRGTIFLVSSQVYLAQLPQIWRFIYFSVIVWPFQNILMIQRYSRPGLGSQTEDFFGISEVKIARGFWSMIE